MNEAWLVAFAFGVASGAAAAYLPWRHESFLKFIRNCGKAQCPHHGPAIRKAISDQNERERHKPPRTQ